MGENTTDKTRDFKAAPGCRTLLRPRMLILMMCGTALNFLLSALIRYTDLPFYIDTVGTIVVTATGGVVPGIITALLTNIINFTLDGESIFYASLNILISLITGYFYESGKIRKFTGKCMFIILIALVGGGLGGLITWYLYREPSSAPMIVYMMNFYENTLGFSVFVSHMIATFVADTLDKTISVILALVIVATIPPKLRATLKLYSWKHKRLSLEEQRSVTKNIKGRVSIGMRTIMVIVLSTFIMTFIVSWFSLIKYRNESQDRISQTASQIAYLAASEIDPDRVGDYVRYGHNADGYDATEYQLRILMESSPDIQFLYVYKIMDTGCRVVFDLDAYLPNGTFVPADHPGEFIDFEIESPEYREALIEGNEIPPVMVHDKYGDFIMAYSPVYDKDGNCVCYAVSNIDYHIIDEFTEDFIGRVILLFMGFFLLIVVFGVWVARYHIVMPIAGMTCYADEVAFMDDEHYAEKLRKMESLDIHTGDEMELLFKALCKMTGDTVAQMNDIRNKSEEISKMQTGLIITMADMVESRDSDTGAHIQKTAAYVRIILEGLKRNGYYTEKLTDKYMRDVEMSAPLHDIGKINISDTVLNKPGKLTDEEFAIMKTHTTQGRKIIESAISKVEGDVYLKEARNMAGYHHERWDGKGYPEGLHGEVIPLSARVMSVADVFDALVSPRVYKPAFPLEKALSIIQEGSGTQFDPKVVEVFMESLPEVIKIMNKYKED